MIRSTHGEAWVWLNAAAVSVCIILVLGLLGLIAIRGLAHFWPREVVQVTLAGAAGMTTTMVGEIHAREIVRKDGVEHRRWLLKSGNRPLQGSDFQWLDADQVLGLRQAADLIVVERYEWGNFYGRLLAIHENGIAVATSTSTSATAELQLRLDRVDALRWRIERLQRDEVAPIDRQLASLRQSHGLGQGPTDDALNAARNNLEQRYRALQQDLDKLRQALHRDSLSARASDGTEVTIALADVHSVYFPNAMSTWDKVRRYGNNLWRFLSQGPREANTEGGVFPAIFGTVLMVILMSILVVPLGVVAAVYLQEYAKQGTLTRAIRVAVNNLAGIPSIVYGVFGLGFFIYTVGAAIDRTFYATALPAPTYGTGGLLWCSLTLALLTLPVVIVATEEGLSRVPRGLREGSVALGATKAETVWRMVLPLASPAVLTGLILAVARAAGEVAPLMLVGVVKLAQALPLDSQYPYLHLERKLMHLGFHIYDVGFQSSNVEASRPLVYATALLLVTVIVVLNLVAVRVRNRLREKYRVLEHAQ